MPERSARRMVGYLWVPHLPLAVALRRRPELDGHAIVVGGDPTSDGAVVDASDDCLAAGVRLGQPLRATREFCPHAVFLPADPVGDRRVHEAALDLVETVSSAVEDDGLGRACFAVEAAAADEGERILTTLRASLVTHLGLRTRLAIAPGKFAARVAAERANGDPVVLAGDVAAYLAPLPIAWLPFGPQARERLRLLGIATVGQLAALPRDHLTRRLGPEAALAHALARGRDDRPIVPRTRPEIRAIRHIFEPAVADRLPLVAVAERILERLCRGLQTEGKAFREIRVAVEFEEGGSTEKVGALREATTALERSRTTLRGLVEAVAGGGPVAAATVTVAALGPASGQQLALLDAAARDERRGRLDRATREVARRYPARLHRVSARSVPTLLDEYQFALLPYEPDERKPPVHGAKLANRRVEVVRRGARFYLVDGDRWDEVVAQHGSWRAEEWWPAAIVRTYWRVRTRSKRVCTLSRDAQGWRLVETFD